MEQTTQIQLVECPRDAMQGIDAFIATEDKIAYLNSLLKVGFHTLDCGSFVSAKAIPQLADTKDVLSKLNVDSKTKLLTIVANERGAMEACSFDNISYLGYPFSISETFQQKNTNAGIEASKERLLKIQEIVTAADKELVVYISMAFGNPYQDPFDEEIVYQYAEWIRSAGVNIISLADTVGIADANLVKTVTTKVVETLKDAIIGVHLHTTAGNWKPKLEAALEAGCKRIDGALFGHGGCPMVGDDLVGNMDTLQVISYFKEKGMSNNINFEALSVASNLAQQIFIH